MRSTGSPLSSSPPRKRIRLSSPTYDSQYDLSQEILDAFDECDRRMSQLTNSPSKSSQFLYGSDAGKYDRNIAASMGLKDISPVEDAEDSFDPPGSPTTEIARRKVTRGNGKDKADDFGPPKSFTPTATFMEDQFSPPGLGGLGFISALQARAQEDTPNSPPIPSTSGTSPNQGLDSWFSSGVPTHAVGFASASSLFKAAAAPTSSSKSMEDDADWFQPSTKPTGFAGFQSAKALKTDYDEPESSQQQHQSQQEVPAFVGFTSASSLHSKPANQNPGSATIQVPSNAGPSKSSFAPSKAALRAAQEKMKQWEQEIDNEFSASTSQDEDLPSVSVVSSGQVVFGMDENSSMSAQHQDPTSSTSTSLFKRPMVSASSGGFPARNQKPFKSPLLVPHTPKPAHTSKASGSIYAPSPLNPNRVNEPKFNGVFPSFVQSSTLSTPIKSGVPASPTKKTLGVTPRRVSGSSVIGKSKFVTPFKSGMKPGEPGRAQLSQRKTSGGDDKASGKITICTPQRRKSSGSGSPKKIPLASSGLFPQSHSPKQLKSMGMHVNVSELGQVSPRTALFYSFHSASSTALTLSQIPATAVTLGSSAAFDQLKQEGCSLATKEWVENHWCMILWKLAGMVCLDPEREADPEKKRWCWAEVMRQLRYRYERELNGVSRPALRLITTQDAPSTSPMVLCVSDIFYNEDVKKGPREIEVTDGWYRLRAEIDEPLSRAISRGIIRVGRKLAMSGIRVENDRKEGSEILEAYGSIALKLHGNSCHLAPWHAKLGFQKDPFISTLRSLTPDGGPVAVLDLVITKVHEFGFIEFNVDEEGKRVQGYPMQMKEEHSVRERWKAKREAEATKLRSEYEKEIQRYEGYIERLSWRNMKPYYPSEDESPPSKIDDLLLELEDETQANAVIKKTILPLEVGWLIRAIQEKCAKDREKMSEEIERELNDVCPPRDVRSFRVIEAEDAQSDRRPAKRKVQMTVWNASTLMLSENGEPGDFRVDQRFLVTNLWPTHHGAWMRPDEESLVHLSTRRDTRWTRVL